MYMYIYIYIQFKVIYMYIYIYIYIHISKCLCVCQALAERLFKRQVTWVRIAVKKQCYYECYRLSRDKM